MTPTYIHLESIRSTNTYLAQNAEGAVHGTVVYADCQTAGRGQRGNSWESADFKNITMSMLLRPANVKPSCQFWLSEAVALAVVHTLDRYIDNGVSIKWPNDIYWNDRKICGILVEHSLSGGKIDHTIAGIGLNINQEKFLSDAPNPVSLRQIIGCDTPLPDVLHHLSEELLRLADSHDSLTVVDDQTGSPTYTPDLARLICDMIKTEKYGTYHASNEGFCTWAQFAKEIMRQAGKTAEIVPCTTEQYPAKAKRPKNSRLSKKCLDYAGFDRLPPWQDALARFLKELDLV